MASRGQLTPKIQEIAKEFLGREMTTAELRLIPYVQYCMCNDRKLHPKHINQEERRILTKWKNDEHMDGGATGLLMTKEFWDFMCEVLWYAYATYDCQEEE